jgi:hypothetical protein
MSRNTIASALVILLFSYATTACAVTIEVVPVGNPGNAPDARYVSAAWGDGAVGYGYSIGKYEVTAGQYCDFLNAVARV